jgi:hypothetical protein
MSMLRLSVLAGLGSAAKAPPQTVEPEPPPPVTDPIRIDQPDPEPRPALPDGRFVVGVDHGEAGVPGHAIVVVRDGRVVSAKPFDDDVERLRAAAARRARRGAARLRAVAAGGIGGAS